MRVLYWIDSRAAKIPGGHRVQFEQTMLHVQKLGASACLTFERPSNLDNVDIIHGLSLTAADVKYCKIQKRILPVVLSTIYCSNRYKYPDFSLCSPLRRYARRARLALQFSISAAIGEHQALCRHVIADQYERRAAYEAADLLLPNSHEEAALLKSELNVATPMKVVVNAVNQNLFTPEGRSDETGYVLYAARFEPHKNQLALIKAMRGTDIPVVLVGACHPDHQRYYQRCIRESAKCKNIRILPAVDHEQLVGLYRSAKVHAMPSFFETTGLSSLEAALSGCNVVAGNRGYAREYFGEDIWWCDPYNTESIRGAVIQAFNAPFRSNLRDHILRNYTWEHTAQQTLQAYEQLLEGRFDVGMKAQAHSSLIPR